MLRSSPLIAALLASLAAASNPPVTVSEGSSETALTLRNGFLSVTFDLLCPRISSLKGDARGNSGYGVNVLVPRTGVRLEMQPFDARGCMAPNPYPEGGGELGSGKPVLPCPYANSPARTSAQHGCHSKALGYRVAVNTTSEVSVVIEGVVDSVDSSTVSSAWTLTRVSCACVSFTSTSK